MTAVMVCVGVKRRSAQILRRGIGDDRVASLCLGSIHGEVGLTNQVLCVDGMGLAESHADAGGKHQRRDGFQPEGGIQGCADLFSNSQGGQRVFHAHEQDDELVPPPNGRWCLIRGHRIAVGRKFPEEPDLRHGDQSCR